MAKKPSEGDPLALYREAQRLREQADKTEAEAIRLALIQHSGFEVRAADTLGMKRSSFKRLLLSRHPKMGELAAKLRSKVGYAGGNPNLSVEPDK